MSEKTARSINRKHTRTQHELDVHVVAQRALDAHQFLELRDGDGAGEILNLAHLFALVGQVKGVRLGERIPHFLRKAPHAGQKIDSASSSSWSMSSSRR